MVIVTAQQACHSLGHDPLLKPLDHRTAVPGKVLANAIGYVVFGGLILNANVRRNNAADG